MSGTSLDGLDICCVEFGMELEKWHYRIVAAEAVEYPQKVRDKIASAQNMSAQEYALFHSEYGLLLGQMAKRFMNKYEVVPDYIASHGHTIFHQPAIGFTAQIGSGAGIAAESGIDTICDFRATDVALGGQGAPLVPIGDKNLFADYSYCLNIGGFSNISYNSGDKRVAYDISPVNYVLNHYTRLVGLDYDKDGEIARSGEVNGELLADLNGLDFYRLKGPKSLGREWVEDKVVPLIDSYGLEMRDRLATFCEHVAVQIGKHVKSGRVLVTGGGAFNKYLLERMSANTIHCEYVIPDPLTVNFKEALIFAFLGALYVNNLPNCLSSVTGARYDNIGGALYKAGSHRCVYA